MKSFTTKKQKLILNVLISTLLSCLLILSAVGIYLKLNNKQLREVQVGPLDFSISAWDGETSNGIDFNENFAERGSQTKTINSAASFVYFVNQVNSGNTFENFTIYLNSNIDLQGYALSSIGTENIPFKGVFDGGYYTILNAKMKGEGLFAHTKDATIKNVGLYNCNAYLVDNAVNTNIENCFVRLGNSNLVNEFTSNNGAHHIKNSFVHTEANGLINKIDTSNSAENQVLISNCYYTSGTAAVNTYIGQSYVVEEKVVKATSVLNFANWSYSANYSVGKDWCDYDYMPGTNELDFIYPLQKGFVKVYLTGSCFEGVVIVGDKTIDATNLAQAFVEADKAEEAKINVLVEKVFMEAQAEVNNAKVTINSEIDTTIVRGENNTNSMFVSTGSSKIVIGDENQTANITLDGNKDYIEEKNLTSGALIVATGGDIEIHENVVLKNNVNNSINYGGAVFVYNSSEPVRINATIENCHAQYGGGVAVIGSLPAALGSIKDCSATHNGGAAYLAEKLENNLSVNALSNIYSVAIHLTEKQEISTGTINIAGQTYENNLGEYGAAIYLSGNALLEFGESEEERTHFISNFGLGGAICFKNVPEIATIKFVSFDSNRQYNNLGLGGGAILIDGASGDGEHIATFGEGCKFINNYAYYNGGAIYSNAYNLNFTDTAEFNSNRADDGAAIYVNGNLTISGGSSFNSNKASDHIIHVTKAVSISNGVEFVENQAGKAIVYAEANTIIDGGAFSNNVAFALIGARLENNSTINLNGGTSVDNEIKQAEVVVENADGTAAVEVLSNCLLQSIHINNGSSTPISITIKENLLEEQAFKISVDNFNAYANTDSGCPILKFGNDLQIDLSKCVSIDCSIVAEKEVDNVVYAYFTIYEIEYVLLDDNTTKQQYKAGSEINLIANPKREGYTFEGWYIDNNFDVEFTETIMPAENFKLYAKWEIIVYNISFVVDENSVGFGAISINNGTETSIRAEYGERVSFNKNILTIGEDVVEAVPNETTSEFVYKFVSWEGALESVDGNVEIKAHFTRELNKHLITIQSNDNSYGFVSKTGVTVQYGTTVSAENNVLTVGAEEITATPSENTVKFSYAFVEWSGVPENKLVREPVTITAIFNQTINQYKVKFDANGGDVQEAERMISYEANYGPLPVPTREGYGFKGWFTEQDSGELITENTIMSVAEEHTLYARWEEGTFVLTLDFKYDNLKETYDLKFMANIELPQDTTREGHTFEGWFADEGCTEVFAYQTMPAKNVTAYAKWQINKYTITATKEGEGTIDPTGVVEREYSTNQLFTFVPAEGYHVQSVVVDEVALNGNELSSAINGGYEFKNIKKTHTIHVLFVQTEYTLTYDLNYDVENEIQIYHFNDQINLINNPEREGYTFEGWFGDSEFNQSFALTTMPSRDVTIYAKWKINQYTITYNYNDNNATADLSQTYDYNESIVLPTQPTRDGFEFGGWYYDLTYSNEFVLKNMPAENVVVYAKWLQNAFTLTLDYNCQELENQTKDFEVGEKVVLSGHAEREGYTLTGWFIDENCQIPFDFIMPSNNLTIYAKWQINTYTITYVLDEDGEVYKTSNHEFNAEIALPTEPSKVGYTFVGWFDQNYVELLANTKMPSKDMMVTAKWQINTYTITYKLEQGEEVYASETYSYNAEITLPEEPSQVGYTFVGWFDQNDVQITSNMKMPAENVTAFAKWQINTYTITYKLEQNGQIYKTLSYEFNSQVTLPTEPNKVGYTFVGWFDENLVEITEQTLMPAENIIVIGKWEINTYTITYKLDQNGEVYQTLLYEYNSQILLPVDPIKAGHKFLGWYQDDERLLNGTQMPAENLEVVAKWETNKYVITSTSIGNGTISPQGNIEKEYQSNQLFVFNANKGYHVSKITVDSVVLIGQDFELAVQNGYKFTNIQEVHSIVVEFEINIYTIMASSEGSGTINPNGESLYEFGQNATFIISPNIGSLIRKITVDGKVIEQDFDNTLQYEYVFESVDRDHTINVEFSSNDFTITVTYEGGGEVTPNGVVSVTSGDNKSFAFNPNEGHYVSAIVIDNQNLTGSTLTNTITKGYYNFENITANHSIHIVFTSYTYKIDIKINGNGTVSCDQDLTSVKYGEDRTIKLNVNLDNYGVEVYINGKKVHVNSNDLVIVNIKEDITIEITFDKKAFFETKTGLTIIITISVLLILIIVSIPIIRTIIRRKRYRIIK